ncbi:MAG TPA: carboxypeptidase-like regulatory domain-containing protein [Pyrinomonadaceae bacterium]
MSRGRAFNVLAAALVLVSACAEAAASCGFDPSPPCQAFWRADVVFVGTVVELTYSEKYRKSLDGGGEWDARDRLARFHVEEVFRGEAVQNVTVTATEILDTPVKNPDGSSGSKSISTGDCEYRFKPGERYVVYANFDRARAGTLRVRLNRTRTVERADEDLTYLRGLKTAGPGARVYGRVLRRDRDLKDGNTLPPAPVEGARVEVSAEGGGPARAAVTDREGFYEVAGLAPGRYVVRAQMPEGFAAYGEQKAEVVARGCAEVNVHTQSDGRVAGRVVDAEGRPVAELKVDLIDAAGPGISLKGMWATTDGEGRYELKGVPPGRYLLGFGLGSEPDARWPFPRTYYPGAAGAAQATPVEVAFGQRVELLDLRLPPRRADRAVEVEVVWPDGRPVEDARLRLEDDDYWWSAAATRQEKLEGAGRYRVTGFEGVTYWLHAYVSMESGQMHAEPVRFRMGEVGGPFRLVITSQGGTCSHYPGARNRRR